MLQKNSNLIINICEVQIKSARGSAFPELAAIYTTLSKIGWKSDAGIGDGGILYKNKLSLSYPGLSKDQFRDLDKFLRGLYLVKVKTEEAEWYQLAPEENPMAVECSFSNGLTKIDFSQEAIEPIQYLGNSTEEEQAEIGFPYYLTFNLA